jgi:hypothetical protein
MAYRDVAAAQTRIEQLESELAVVKAELAASKRPVRPDGWLMVFAGVVFGASVVAFLVFMWLA